MELEFDKEIDTILRKARDPAGVSVTAANAGHLDADTVAAFAENAVPPKAKLLYMEHFADCDVWLAREGTDHPLQGKATVKLPD